MTVINEDNFEDFIAGFLLESQGLSKEAAEMTLADKEEIQRNISVLSTSEHVTTFIEQSRQEISMIWSMYEDGIMEVSPPLIPANLLFDNAIGANGGKPLSPLQIAITWIAFQNGQY